MQGLRRYLPLLKPYWHLYAAGLGLLLVCNAANLLVPWLTKVAVDSLTTVAKGGGGDVVGKADAASAEALKELPAWLLEPVNFVAVFLAVGALLAATRTGSRILVLGVGRQLQRDLRRKLFDRLLRAAPSYYSRFGTGEIMSRCISDVRILQSVAAPGVLYTFNAVFMFGIAVPYLLTIDAELTGYLLLPYPFLAVATMLLATRVRAFASQAQEAMADLTTRIQEALGGMEVVKAFSLERRELERFGEANDDFLEKSMKEAVVRGGIGILSTFTGGVATMIILWVGGSRVATGKLTYGDMVLFLGVMALVLRPTIYLGWVLSLAQRGLASLDRIDELLLAEITIESPPDAHRGALTGRVEAQGLSYRYATLEPRTQATTTGGGEQALTSSGRQRELALSATAERRLALDDVSFTVEPGGLLGLLGRVGSGKSTLLRAIPRFLELPADAVKVDGVAVEKWDLAELRRSIGYVPQDGYTFSLTVGANVAFGVPEASQEQILEAARIAELEKDLDQLEHGLESMVGERGVTLSGGQRQRLAIARAVLLQPKVLLLDDALSMVDAETAVAILKNLHQALPETTMIVAAHRTATLLGCDELLVLEQGRVIERGTPDELLAEAGSWFKAMHERQRLEAEITETA